MIAAYRWVLDKFKSRKITVILSIFFLLVIIAAAFYVFSPKKTPKEIYFDAESMNFTKYSESIKKSYKEFYASQEPYMNSRHKRRSEMTLKMEPGSDKPFGLENAKSIFDLVERCKIVIDSNCNPTEEKSVSNVSLLLEKAPLIDAQIFTAGKQLGFTVPVFTPDMYFKLDTGRLDEVYDRFGVLVKPESLPGKTGIAKTLVFDEVEFDNAVHEYGRFISGFIEEKDVKFGKTLSLAMGGKEIKGREVVVTIGSNKAKMLVSGLLEKFLSDEVFLKLTYGNYSGLKSLINNTGFFEALSLLEERGRLNLNEHIKSFLSLFEAGDDLAGLKEVILNKANKYEYPKGLKMTVVIDNKGNMLDRSAVILYEEPGSETKNKLEIHMAPNNITNYGFNNISCKVDYEKIENDTMVQRETTTVNTTFDAINKDGDGQGKIEFNYEKSSDTDVEFSILLKAGIEKSTDTALRKNNITRYDIEFKGEDVNLTDKISGEARTSMWKNNKRKTKNTDTNITANIDMPSFDMKDTVFELCIAREDRFDIEEFTVPDMLEMELIDLNDVGDEELAKVKARIMASFGTFYLNNKPIFDAVMK